MVLEKFGLWIVSFVFSKETILERADSSFKLVNVCNWGKKGLIFILIFLFVHILSAVVPGGFKRGKAEQVQTVKSQTSQCRR